MWSNRLRFGRRLGGWQVMLHAFCAPVGCNSTALEARIAFSSARGRVGELTRCPDARLEHVGFIDTNPETRRGTCGGAGEGGRCSGCVGGPGYLRAPPRRIGRGEGRQAILSI